MKKKIEKKAEKTVDKVSHDPQTICAGCKALPITYRNNEGVGFCALSCETNYK